MVVATQLASHYISRLLIYIFVYVEASLKIKYIENAIAIFICFAHATSLQFLQISLSQKVIKYYYFCYYLRNDAILSWRRKI